MTAPSAAGRSSGYPKRLIYLALGQVITALGVVAMLRADIGLEPWSCLHQGLSKVTGIPFGACSIVVAAVVFLIALLLREPVGLGTLINSVVPGILIDLLDGMGLIPTMRHLWSGTLMLLAGAALLALGTYFYMAAAMGAGPRDSLMVAFARVFRADPGVCRTVLDLTVVVVGFLMGGKVGLGTLLAALLLGPCLQFFFRVFHYDPKAVPQTNFAELWADLRAAAQK